MTVKYITCFYTVFKVNINLKKISITTFVEHNVTGSLANQPSVIAHELWPIMFHLFLSYLSIHTRH